MRSGQRYSGERAIVPEPSRPVAPTRSTTHRTPQSDVDLLTVGLLSDRAASIGRSLSTEFSALCRGVEIAAAMAEDFQRADDEAYGRRVFLHHVGVP